MSSLVSPYPPIPPIRSHLFQNPPDAIPTTEDLEALHAEISRLKEMTLERVKKAGADIVAIDASMQRIKEREKDKMKAAHKAERERGLTPRINGDEPRASSSQPPPQPTRTRLGTPSVSIPPSSTPIPEPRKYPVDDLKKKKKKRKREESSDVESGRTSFEPAKVRKASPLPPHTHPHSHPPPPLQHKTSKYPSALNLTSKPATGPADFALPASVTLLPPRPPIAPTPVAGPSKPTDVTEDFSKAKQPNQVLVTTFYTSIEPYLRNIKEEDVGFLEHAGDELEPFVMPPLGRAYAQMWEDDDIREYGAPLPSTSAMRAASTAGPAEPLVRFEPSTLTDADLLSEEKGHAPLVDRMLTAMIPAIDASEWRGVKAAEEAMEGRPGTNGAAAAAARGKLTSVDLAERMETAAIVHGLLPNIPDYTNTVDDPIATALRHAQRELRTVHATNKARRARLAALAQERLGHQEYVESRDALDRNIAALYAKLQKKDGPKAASSKKKKAAPAPAAAAAEPELPPCPAALGLSPDEALRLRVPDALQELVRVRALYVENIGRIFAEREAAAPGRVMGLPRESVYGGVEEEVREALARSAPPPRLGVPGARVRANGALANGADPRTAKGKARAGGDEPMELG